MKIRFLFLIPSILLLTSCSGWFQPLPPYYHWRLHNADALFPESDPDVLTKYVDRRKKDMTDCGIIDWAAGESDNPEVNLCLEKKGCVFFAIGYMEVYSTLFFLHRLDHLLNTSLFSLNKD